MDFGDGGSLDRRQLVSDLRASTDEQGVDSRGKSTSESHP
jgi:hypothetical protein